jgi:adenylosuccinate synthase
VREESKVTALVGGQFGSEGKGTIAYHLAKEYDYHVRSGGPNAGHSFNHNGRVWKMQSVPCGWVNPNAFMIIAAGAVVDLERIHTELTEIEEAGYPSVWSRLFIDANAIVLDERHHAIENGVDGELHQRIGSTGEGVGAVREARMARDPLRVDRVRDKVTKDRERYHWVNMRDTMAMLNGAIDTGRSVLLEGTQGSGLSLIHGPWPYVTSADTNAAQLAADAGIPPHYITDVIMVVRSHPIRVAGNSGPLKNEISWEELSQRLGRDVEERTTVTHKIRRVGEWDAELVERAVWLNGPTSFALTFADYINPEDEGLLEFDSLSRKTKAFISYLESWYGVPVDFVGTGGDGWRIIDRRV